MVVNGSLVRQGQESVHCNILMLKVLLKTRIYECLKNEFVLLTCINNSNFGELKADIVKQSLQ